MINFDYSGKNLPYPNEWEEIKKKYLEHLGPFREELEKEGITFNFKFPMEDYEMPVTFSYHDSRPTFNLVYRMNHYAKTGEYIPPQ